MAKARNRRKKAEKRNRKANERRVEMPERELRLRCWTGGAEQDEGQAEARRRPPEMDGSGE